MAFWDIDLETRMGADSAAAQGGLACFVYAGLTAFSAFVTGAVFAYGTPEGLAALGIFGFQIAVCLLAGFRLRAGKGIYAGMGAAALMALNLLIAVASVQIGLGLIFNALLLLLTVQGIRGAIALRSSHFAEDDIGAFD
ncbi:hypothetical protein [uncultured Erythrobacter sp.]|uniref:hypothetical protein n=1 Tax=uncultured Erythrobacter sp. TaxID=263913 RepID=UPI002633C378|nr:hypothetical protein [uncultured Erythrobacter sp.]